MMRIPYRTRGRKLAIDIGDGMWLLVPQSLEVVDLGAKTYPGRIKIGYLNHIDGIH